jgi:hypothetical protein
LISVLSIEDAVAAAVTVIERAIAYARVIPHLPEQTFSRQETSGALSS